MVFEEFGSFISEICSRTVLAPGRPVYWTIIANPKAGGFTIKSRWKKHRAMLEKCVSLAKKNPLRKENGPSKTAMTDGGTAVHGTESGYGLVSTRQAGHAKDITNALIEEAACSDNDENGACPFHLIVTAGGDGTSLDIMNSLYHAPKEILRNFAVLRLPMGTGNDGSDSRELDKALELLINPVEIKHQRAIKLNLKSGKGPFYAFNILSVGLDAFVTHMTNRMKGKLPGDSYKLWVDIAALFYDRIYKVDFMDVKSLDEDGKEEKAFNEKLLLLAVGESGRRTYGANKKILPDERNICAIRQMPLRRKFLLKELLNSGKHIHEDESILWNGSKVEFISRHPMLAQMDGEAIRLEESDFPAIIELTEPVIPVLKKTASGTN